MSYQDSDNDDTLEPWAQRDEPPSKPVPPKPVAAGGIVPFYVDPKLLYIPKCPKCGHPCPDHRERDGAIWCRGCEELFKSRTVLELLKETGLWPF